MEIHQPRGDAKRTGSKQQIEQPITLKQIEPLAEQALGSKLRDFDRRQNRPVGLARERRNDRYRRGAARFERCVNSTSGQRRYQPGGITDQQLAHFVERVYAMG